jgi:methyl-accepting chemotaxis protein
MSWLDNLGFRGKLALNTALSGGVLALALLLCLLRLGDLKSNIHDLAEVSVPATQLAGKISELRLRYRVRSLEYMLPATSEERAKMETSLRQLDADTRKAIDAAAQLAATNEEKQLLQQVLQGVDAYSQAVTEGIAKIQAGDEEGAQALRRTAWIEKANALRDKTDALSKLTIDLAQHAGVASSESASAAQKTGWIALAVAVMLAVLSSWWLSRHICKVLSYLVEVSRHIASGELSEKVAQRGKDEAGRVLQATEDMRRDLQDVVLRMRARAEQVSSSAEHLNTATQQTETISAMQSEATSAIAANIEQLTVSISHVTQNTEEASELASEADKRANDSGRKLGAVVHEIHQLSDCVTLAAQRIAALEAESNRISGVVTVIKDIAEQTNLLALNAAIEAARAGEQGRGFAVVADEVRKLSERTASSTAEIIETIATIQKTTREAVAGIERGVGSVKTGERLVEEAGASVEEIRTMAGRVANIVGEIALGLKEQSAAATDVAGRVEQIAVHAEELNSSTASTGNAAGELSGIARSMLDAVGHFKVA